MPAGVAAAREAFEAVAAASEGRLAEFKPQEISNIAWSYATVGHDSTALFDALAEACVEDEAAKFKVAAAAAIKRHRSWT